MPLNIMLMGLPGAGKGTQAEKIVDTYHIVHISTGDIFRDAIHNKTKIGIEAEKYIDKGDLVPDRVTDEIVKERLNKDDVNNGYLLDGFPRNLYQAEDLDKFSDEMHKALNGVIYIDIDPKIVKERITGRYICRTCGATYNRIYNPTKINGICDKCGGHDFYQRDDDKPETVSKRLEINIKMNAPLIDFYTKKNLLYKVNGNDDIDIVFSRIKKILDNLK